MKPLEIPHVIPERIEHLLRSLVADAESFGGDGSRAERYAGWQAVTDKLQAWKHDRAPLEDEGVEPLSLEILAIAGEVATSLRDLDVEPPLRVLPNGEAGVVFEWRDPPYLWSLDVEQDQSLSLAVFRNGRLVARHQVS